MKPNRDTELLQTIQQGDREAYDRFFEAYQPLIRQLVCYTLPTGNEPMSYQLMLASNFVYATIVQYQSLEEILMAIASKVIFFVCEAERIQLTEKWQDRYLASFLTALKLTGIRLYSPLPETPVTMERIFRMKEVRPQNKNVKGILFALIVPTYLELAKPYFTTSPNAVTYLQKIINKAVATKPLLTYSDLKAAFHREWHHSLHNTRRKFRKKQNNPE